MPRRGENIYKRKDGRWEGRSLKSDGTYRYFYSRTYKGVKEKMKKSPGNPGIRWRETFLEWRRCLLLI